MDVGKVVGESEPHKMITCSDPSIGPPLLVPSDQEFNSEAQIGIVISHKEGTTYRLSTFIPRHCISNSPFHDKQDTVQARSAR
jgi:hypothetical protein